MHRASIAGIFILGLSAILTAGADGGKASFAEVIKDMLGTMGKLTDALVAIKDEDSARAARPELKKTAAHWLELRQKAEKIKPPTKEEKEKLEKEYKEKLQTAQKKLFTEIARVKGVPGGKDALKEISSVLGKTSK